MREISFLEKAIQKGYTYSSEMYEICGNIMSIFTNYEFAITYISGSAREDIDSAQEPGMHLIIEPLIIPSVSSALCIGMYGDLESGINMICKIHEKSKKLSLSYNDISGKGVERAVTYLEKVVNLDNIKNSIEWNEMNHWNRVRNMLVHNNGFIRDKKDEISINFLKLKIDTEQNKVCLSLSDCRVFNDFIFRFFKLCI